MKSVQLVVLVVSTLSCLLLAQCTVFPDGASEAGRGGTVEQPLGEAYSSVIRLGMVIIMDGTRHVATCRAAAPNVEEARFINRQKQIVVKSRGRHGPATVQLFDTRTGAERDAVMAYDIGNGQPEWAAGLEDSGYERNCRMRCDRTGGRLG